MEQILGKQTATDYPCPYDCPAYGRNLLEYRAHMLPQTDAILDRAVNLSVGVVDGGLGAGFGVNILSSEEEILSTAARVRELAAEAVRGGGPCVS